MNHGKQRWPKIMATVLLLTVLYVSSEAPVIWMLNCDDAIPNTSARVIELVYWPLNQALDQMPAEVQLAYGEYWWWWDGVSRK